MDNSLHGDPDRDGRESSIQERRAACIGIAAPTSRSAQDKQTSQLQIAWRPS